MAAYGYGYGGFPGGYGGFAPGYGAPVYQPQSYQGVRPVTAPQPVQRQTQYAAQPVVATRQQSVRVNSNTASGARQSVFDKMASPHADTPSPIDYNPRVPGNSTSTSVLHSGTNRFATNDEGVPAPGTYDNTSHSPWGNSRGGAPSYAERSGPFDEVVAGANTDAAYVGSGSTLDKHGVKMATSPRFRNDHDKLAPGPTTYQPASPGDVTRPRTIPKQQRQSVFDHHARQHDAPEPGVYNPDYSAFSDIKKKPHSVIQDYDHHDARFKFKDNGVPGPTAYNTNKSTLDIKPKQRGKHRTGPRIAKDRRLKDAAESPGPDAYKPPSEFVKNKKVGKGFSFSKASRFGGRTEDAPSFTKPKSDFDDNRREPSAAFRASSAMGPVRESYMDGYRRKAVHDDLPGPGTYGTPTKKATSGEGKGQQTYSFGRSPRFVANQSDAPPPGTYDHPDQLPSSPPVEDPSAVFRSESATTAGGARRSYYTDLKAQAPHATKPQSKREAPSPRRKTASPRRSHSARASPKYNGNDSQFTYPSAAQPQRSGRQFAPQQQQQQAQRQQVQQAPRPNPAQRSYSAALAPQFNRTPYGGGGFGQPMYGASPFGYGQPSPYGAFA